MKRLSLHIIFLLGFLFVLTESNAQENYSFVEQKWHELNQKTETAELTEVKSFFNEYVELCLKNKQDSLLIEGIGFIGKYYATQNEYGERIRWYQFAIDSLCNDNQGKCLTIRRSFADIYSSIEYYDKAITILEENLIILENEKSYPAITLETALIAKNYNLKKELVKSEEFYLKSLSAANQSENIFFVIYAYNNLGFFYSQVNDYQKAEKNYLKGIQILEEKDSLHTKQQAQLALLRGNLGGIYLKTGVKLEQGINLLNEDFRYHLENGDFTLAINACIELATFYYENKYLGLANETLEKSLNIIRNQNIDNVPRQNIVLVYYMLFKINLEQQKNNLALVYFKSYDSLKGIKDDLREVRRISIEKSLLENILNVQLENQSQQIELKNKENEALQEKNRHFFYRLVIGIISFVTFAILIILYFRKRISLMRINKELAENKFEVEKLEKDKTKLELIYKNKDLTDFAIDISRKQEVLVDVKFKLNEILDSKFEIDETKKEIKKLINYTNNNMLVDEQLKEFQENVEEVNYKFLDQLKERYPELTELDKNVCGLIRLGLSNKEIATMRNVSYKAIRMSRYRIRKKLGLAKEVNLVEFLKSIE